MQELFNAPFMGYLGSLIKLRFNGKGDFLKPHQVQANLIFESEPILIKFPELPTQECLLNLFVMENKSFKNTFRF